MEVDAVVFEIFEDSLVDEGEGDDDVIVVVIAVEVMIASSEDGGDCELGG